MANEAAVAGKGRSRRRGHTDYSMADGAAVAGLAALAHIQRLGIFRLLIRVGFDGLAAGEIGERVGVAPSTLSFHLGQLERAGLLRSSRNGRRIIYAIDVEGTRRLLAFLTEGCCGGKPEFCGDLVETTSVLEER